MKTGGYRTRQRGEIVAVIHETLMLEDKFSSSFSAYIRLAEKGASSTKEMNAAARAATNDAKVLTAAYRTQAAQAAANAAEQRRLAVQKRTEAAASRSAAAAARTAQAQAKASAAALRTQAEAHKTAAAAARAQMAQTNALAAAERLEAQRAREAARANQTLSDSQEQVQASSNALTGTIRNLAGAFLGIQTGQWLVNTSDQLTQINARLQLMTGSAEAAAEANDQIYQAAMRARGAYTDMADLVSQLGTLAPEAFSDPTGNLDTGELIAFAEQLQKQMALSGTSTMAAQAAMLQLTQGPRAWPRAC